jgi:carboxyvinyl-carboxyphosphonate phosphorylmutase
MQWRARRERFRAILNGNGCIHPASVFDPLSARIAEHLGFELGLLAGSTASLAVLGAPDLVLLTASELAQQAQRICRAVNLPLLVDADHGYGNALNVARTIEELGMVGVAAATIEDTNLPLPFAAGGRSGLISPEEAVGKLRAALAARPDPSFAVIGRTSAPMIADLGDTVARLRAYEHAGVDALFIVGLKSLAQLSTVSAATTLPLILAPAAGDLVGADLSGYRVKILLQGHAPMLAAVQAIYETMKALREGVAPAQIKNVASNALMSTLTRAAHYDEATKDYL